MVTSSIPLEKTKILFYSNKHHVTICSFDRRKSKVSFDKVAEFSTVSKLGYNYHIGQSCYVINGTYVRKFGHCSFNFNDLSFLSNDLYYRRQIVAQFFMIYNCRIGFYYSMILKFVYSGKNSWGWNSNLFGYFSIRKSCICKDSFQDLGIYFIDTQRLLLKLSLNHKSDKPYCISLYRGVVWLDRLSLSCSSPVSILSISEASYSWSSCAFP